MWKKAIVLVCFIALLAGTPEMTEAGWWHHGQAYYAQPVYFAAPAAPQAQDAPATRLIEALIPVVLDIARQKLGQTVIGGTSPPPPPGSGDLASLKSDLAQIAAGLENTNTTLRRHGEDLSKLRLDLTDVQGKVDNLKLLVDSNSTLQKNVEKIVAKLPKQTKEELLKALTSADFVTQIGAHPKLNDEDRKALVKKVSDDIQAILKVQYGE